MIQNLYFRKGKEYLDKVEFLDLQIKDIIENNRRELYFLLPHLFKERCKWDIKLIKFKNTLYD